MNKLVTVLGVAAVATLAGCKDPNYKPMSSQDDVKVVEPAPAPNADVKIVPATCKCPPGTKHTAPCACGAPDCKCVVVAPAPAPAPVPAPAPAPVVAPVPAPATETTNYIVQSGDYLAKISKKFNVTIGSIKKLNGLKSDTIRVGQTLKLPGKVDVGVQAEPAKAEAVKKAVARGAAEFKGATKEYVVKNGDTLGAIAYGNGCNIRQLKKLNNLTSDTLKVGQKLKVPADAKAAEKAPAAAEKKPEAAVAKKATEAKKPVEKKTAAEAAPAAPAAAPATPAPEAAAPAAAPETPAPEAAAPAAPAPAPAPAAPAATTTYTVKEGDDITGVSIRFGASVAAIRELNNLAEDAQLTVGQVIKLPAEAQQ